MDKSVPMLSDPKHLRTWELLDSASGSKRRKTSESALRRAMESIMSMEEPDGVLIRRAVEISYRCFPEGFKDTVLSLEPKLGEGCADAVLHISDLLLDIGDKTFAESLMSKSGDAGDRELACRVRGKMGLLFGNRDEAAVNLVDAWSLNPNDPDIYDLLEKAEPDYGWQYIRCIEAMWSTGELPPVSEPVQSVYSELYDCCCGWAAGRRADAIKEVCESERFRTDSYFQVTYARMSLFTGVYAKALDVYRSALQMSPGFVFAMSEAASAMRLSGDYQGAIDMCHSALERYPGCRNAFEQMIRAAADSGRKHETDTYISKYLSLQPEDARAYAFCASVLFDTGFPMEATNLVNRMEARCTDRAYACLQLSVDEARNGDWKRAVTDANRAKKLAPGSMECMCQCARSYLGIGNIKNAEREADAAVAAAPNSISALTVRKDVHIGRGEHEQALQLLDRIITLAPRDASIRKDRADLLGEMGRYSESLDGYRDSLNIRDDLRLFISVILKMLKDRKIGDLCRFVDDYDDSYGGSPEVWMIRGNGEYLSGMYDEAASSYARACALSYNDPVIWHSKGMAEQKAGDLNAAQASFDRAIILDLENPDYWISKTLVQEESGDISGAVRSVNKVIGLAPNSVYALVVKSRLMVASKMYDEALFFLDLALHITPNDGRLYGLKRDICMHIGRYEDAETICDKMLQIDRQDLRTEVDRVMAILGSGRADEAQIRMNELHNKYNGDHTVMKGEARFYMKLTEYQHAYDVYENIHDKFPEDTESAEELLALCRSMGMDDRAEELDAELHPDRAPEVAPVIIDEPRTEGSAEEPAPEPRVTELDRLLDSDLSSPEPFLEFIDSMIADGDIDSALKAAEKARSLFSSDARVMDVLGDLYMETGDTLAALASYEEAADSGMSGPELMLKKGDAEYELSLYQRALESYSEVVRQDPVHRDALMGMCRVYMKLSQRDEAAPLLDSVLIRDPSDAEALKMRTEIYLWHNDSEGILSLYPMVEKYVSEPSDLEFFSGALRSIGEEERASALFSPYVSGPAAEETGTEVPEPEPEPVHRAEEPIAEFDDSIGHMERSEEEIEEMAVEVLARSLDLSRDADSPEIYSGLDAWDAEAVRRFFRTAQPCPFVNPGDSFFDDYESISYDIIVGEGLKHMEDEPVVSLEIVYRHCPMKELDPVRRMQAYMAYSVTGDYDPIPFSKSVEELADEVKRTDLTVYGVMKKFNVGVYTASTAIRLSRQ